MNFKKLLVNRACELVEISESELERKLWSRVSGVGDDCWIWQGASSSEGYGEITHQRKHYATHRLAFTVVYGEIPAGMCVLHRCDTPLCVNPHHLRAGTKADNMADMKLRRRGSGSKKRRICKQVGI